MYRVFEVYPKFSCSLVARKHKFPLFAIKSSPEPSAPRDKKICNRICGLYKPRRRFFTLACCRRRPASSASSSSRFASAIAQHVIVAATTRRGRRAPRGPSKDATRAYSVKNVNKPWQRRRRRTDTTRFFCVSPRVSIASGRSLSRRVINVRIMRGFPGWRGIRRADKAPCSSARPRAPRERQYGAILPNARGILRRERESRNDERRDATRAYNVQSLPRHERLRHCRASARPERAGLS